MKRSYKIAFLLPFLESQGGVTVSVRTIGDYLSRLGHEVHYFPIGKTQTAPSNFIHPINTNSKHKQENLLRSIFHELDKTKPFDLVISNHLVGNYLLDGLDVGERNMIILRQPSLLKRKNMFSRFKKYLTYPKIYNNKNIVAISKCLLEDFLQRYDYIHPKSSRVIYNAFDATTLQQKADEAITTPCENYIINVGRFTKTKNQALLIEAFARIKNKEIALVLLGEGKEEKRYRELVRQKGLQDRVHFVSWQKNPYAWIKKAKLLVHTSRSETFGRVILEGLALDTPVICTDIKCGPNEILTGKLASYLVPDNDLDALVQTIDKALDYYPEITQKDLEKFQIANIAQRYIDFIDGLKQRG